MQQSKNADASQQPDEENFRDINRRYLHNDVIVKYITA